MNTLHQQIDMTVFNYVILRRETVVLFSAKRMCEVVTDSRNNIAVFIANYNLPVCLKQRKFSVLVTVLKKEGSVRDRYCRLHHLFVIYLSI